MRTITINRKKWLRGPQDKSDGQFFDTMLYNADAGAGCCLGHVIHQVKRCSWEDLNMIPSPEEAVKSGHTCSILVKERDDKLVNNSLSDAAMMINDGDYSDTKDGEQKREQHLTKLFKEHNIKLIFKGESSWEQEN